MHPMDASQAAAPPSPAQSPDAAAGPPARYSSGAIPPIRPRRMRMFVIVGSAVLVLATATAVFVMLSNSGTGRSDEAEAQPSVAPPPPADAAEARAADDAAIAAAAGDAAPEVPAPAAPDAGAAIAPPGGCSFDVATTPPGAEVLAATGEVIATAPAKLTFPCDVEIKLTFRKARYVTAERKYTPTANGKPLKVALARPTVLVKVSSSPSGAAVTVGGKPQGFTPTTIRIPLNLESTLTISKDGYTPDTQKITPKQNNQAVNAILKRGPPRKAPR
jgi:hypothetical protein